MDVVFEFSIFPPVVMTIIFEIKYRSKDELIFGVFTWLFKYQEVLIINNIHNNLYLMRVTCHMVSI